MAHAQGRKGQGRKIAGLRGKFRYSNGDWKRSIERFHERSAAQEAGRALQSQSLSSAEWVESLRSLNLLGERSPGEDVLLVVKSEAGPDRVVQLSELVRRASARLREPRPSLPAESQGEPGIGDAIGPFYRAEHLAKVLDISEDELQSRSDAGDLLRLQTSDELDVWPAMQLDEANNPPAGLAEVLSAVHELFQDEDGWASAFWLAAPSDAEVVSSPTRIQRLQREGPAELLRLIDRMRLEQEAMGLGDGRKDEASLRAAMLDAIDELWTESKMPLWTTIGSGSKARGGEQ